MRQLKSSFIGVAAVLCIPPPMQASASDSCSQQVDALITVDHGHPWLPPFGLDRVGSALVAHVQMSPRGIGQDYYLAAYEGDNVVERLKLSFARNASIYGGLGFAPPPTGPQPQYAHVGLTSMPTKVVLEGLCDGRINQFVEQSVTLASIEADAVARPDEQINPVDLGAIFPPHDWLLLDEEQPAVIRVTALARATDLPDAVVHAWFDGGVRSRVSMPLVAGQRSNVEFRLPQSVRGDRTTLHVTVADGKRMLWKREIPTMLGKRSLKRPAFGVITTKLRYDLPILRYDATTGASLTAIRYEYAWDEKFSDVIVFLPNGSRFVFWRGSNYVPFWAGKYNTGTTYQWAEDCSGGFIEHPDGSRDCPEPLFDSELRHSRVRVLESSTSRIHVRWDYQLTDVRYQTRRGQAAEDFFFYPDGFGTRVVTVPNNAGTTPQLTEIIVITPAAAYPFEILPRNIFEVIPLDGEKELVAFPSDQLRNPEPENAKMPLVPLTAPRQRPVMFRILSHKQDRAAAIYYHPSDPAVPNMYPPMYDQAQLVTPAYWGNHWPLSRGKWTGWSINDQIGLAPSHSSLAGWPTIDRDTGRRAWEVAPLTRGEWVMPDTQGQARAMNVSRFTWLIAQTDASDDSLRRWGMSFSSPPSIELTGARLDVPSYSVERRALRMVAEQPSISIRLKPNQGSVTVNPVFEIDDAPTTLEQLTIDDETLPAEAFRWDGRTLWVAAIVPDRGAELRIRFRQ